MSEIASLKIFEWIDKETVDHIFLNSKEEKFNTWEIIFFEWENSNWKWYIIKSWKIAIKIKWSKIAELWEWDIFWEIALLNEEQRTATVETISEVEVVVLTINSLIDMLNNDENKINKEIMRRIEENIANG